ETPAPAPKKIRDVIIRRDWCHIPVSTTPQTTDLDPYSGDEAVGSGTQIHRPERRRSDPAWLKKYWWIIFILVTGLGRAIIGPSDRDKPKSIGPYQNQHDVWPSELPTPSRPQKN